MNLHLDTMIARAEPPSFRWEKEVVEIPLLLPASQLKAIEQLAHGNGVSAAEMVRRVLLSYLNASPEREV